MALTNQSGRVEWSMELGAQQHAYWLEVKENCGLFDGRHKPNKLQILRIGSNNDCLWAPPIAPLRYVQ